MRPKVVFFGTPDFAVPCLEALLGVADVPLVVCQPDRKSGRGLKLTPPPVKVCAEKHGLLVRQPTRLRPPEFAESLRSLRADLAVVVAYGRILPRAVLDAPRLGCVNVHGSLLPRWRGAAPIQWAVRTGDKETGVCLMQMDEGLDTGDVLHCERTPIGPDETAGDVFARLSELGAKLIREQLPRFLAGELRSTPQDDTKSTIAPVLTKNDGVIDWSLSAKQVHDLVRGMSPWPGAFTFVSGKRLKVHRTQLCEVHGAQREPGAILRADRHGFEVQCGDGAIALQEVQPDGKKRLSASEYVMGYRPEAGQKLGDGRRE